MVIAEVLAKDSAQVPFIQNDHTIQTFSANGTDNSFYIRILPRVTGRRDNFVNTQVFNPPTDLFTTNGITIAL